MMRERNQSQIVFYFLQEIEVLIKERVKISEMNERVESNLVIKLTQHGNTTHDPMGLRLVRRNAHIHNKVC